MCKNFNFVRMAVDNNSQSQKQQKHLFINKKAIMAALKNSMQQTMK